MTHDDLLNVLAHWHVGDLVRVERPKHGATNQVYFVTTTKGHFVLVRYVEQTMRSLPWMLHLMQQLPFAGVKVPQPIAAKQQQLCFDYQRQPVAMFEFLAGRGGEQSLDDCRLVGMNLAKLHQSDIRHEHRPNPVDATTLLHELKGLSIDASKVNYAQQVIDDFRLLYRQKLPTGLIHGDLFCDNAIILDDGQMAVIDWEYCCHDLLIYDLAITLNAWCVNEQGIPQKDLDEALLAGYQSIRALSQVEQQALPLARQMAALRFWIRRQANPNGKAAEPLWRLLREIQHSTEERI